MALDSRFLRLAKLLCLVVLATSTARCSCAATPLGSPCTTNTECRDGRICSQGACVLPDGSVADGGDASASDMGQCPTAHICGAHCCSAIDVCIADTVCAPTETPCTSTDECPGDTICDATLAHCIPYGTAPAPDFDPSCLNLSAAGVFAPTVQCAFDTAPTGDPFPMNVHVLTTPMVVDFGIDRGPDAPRRPSIVAVFDDGEDGGSELPTGVIRILDGATCVQQAELGSLQLVSHSSPVAVGDLTGDGRAEIVAYKAGGGLVAFTFDTTAHAWTILWRSTLADGVTPYDVVGGGWGGPTLVDLDNDGSPEILRAGIVLDAQGRLIDDTSLGLHPYHSGIFGIAIDVDADGRVEFIAGDGVWEWNATTRSWAAESYVMTPRAAGHIAVADFGDFPGAMAWPAATPEVVAISLGMARVQTLDGTIVFGPVALPGEGSGGPPTIGDFDGDGRPEFASAGANAYSVFDLDCGPSPIGTCATGTTTGVLWSQRSQDASSNVTGSSIFDFEGDGRAEAVYGDECFVRVYDGPTGDVLFSQSRSSCTWYENPVVADLDGDYNAEIVIGDNYNCGSASSGTNCSAFDLDARSTDPIFAGLRCDSGADCLSGDCDEGFCRCTIDTECCAGAGCASAHFVCAAPPTGTPGSGNTCRAARPIGTKGIRVYRDAADRWVRSRMVWNQHAYYVTNVSEEGVVPMSSAVESNWLDPALNNFRQNVQGDAPAGASPDLTSSGSPLVCDDTGAHLIARICNRGTEPVGSGVTVGFYLGDPMSGGTRLCDAASVGDLTPGMCESVDCPWADAPLTAPGVDVYVVADDGHVASECREANNITVFRDVYCGRIF
ncbi:MAG: hypothetical protein IPK60_05640 [Sandaracinaceae bacterium]|nr:hypothetical protein [Sandaracinaceae bacterium]